MMEQQTMFAKTDDDYNALVAENEEQRERIKSLEEYIELQSRAYSKHFEIDDNDLFDIVCKEYRDGE